MLESTHKHGTGHMSMRADIIVKNNDSGTLAKLEEVMDVVPADFSEISDFHWRKIIPACELTKVSNEIGNVEDFRRVYM